MKYVYGLTIISFLTIGMLLWYKYGAIVWLNYIAFSIMC